MYIQDRDRLTDIENELSDYQRGEKGRRVKLGVRDVNYYV